MEMRRKSPLLIAITFFGGMLLLPQLSRAEDNQQQQQAFECFTCNVEKGADDTRPCVDKVENISRIF
jgi:hypothetical protein